MCVCVCVGGGCVCVCGCVWLCVCVCVWVCVCECASATASVCCLWLCAVYVCACDSQRFCKCPGRGQTHLLCRTVLGKGRILKFFLVELSVTGVPFPWYTGAVATGIFFTLGQGDNLPTLWLWLKTHFIIIFKLQTVRSHSVWMSRSLISLATK